MLRLQLALVGIILGGLGIIRICLRFTHPDVSPESLGGPGLTLACLLTAGCCLSGVYRLPPRLSWRSTVLRVLLWIWTFLCGYFAVRGIVGRDPGWSGLSGGIGLLFLAYFVGLFWGTARQLSRVGLPTDEAA